MSLKIIEGTVKVNKDHQGTLVNLGILESDRKYSCISAEGELLEQVQDKARELIKDALSGLIDQFADIAEQNNLSGEFQTSGMLENVNDFNILAGSGFSTVRKAQIIEEKYEDLVERGVEEPTVDLFLPPKKGSVKVDTPVSVVGGLTL